MCRRMLCIFSFPIFERQQALASILELFLQLITTHFNKITSLSRKENRVVRTMFVPVVYNELFFPSCFDFFKVINTAPVASLHLNFKLLSIPLFSLTLEVVFE